MKLIPDTPLHDFLADEVVCRETRQVVANMGGGGIKPDEVRKDREQMFEILADLLENRLL